MDPGPRPTNAEIAQLVEILEKAGLVEVYLDEEGREAYRLTEDGVLGTCSRWSGGRKPTRSLTPR